MSDHQKENKRERAYEAVEIPQRQLEEIRRYEHRIGAGGNCSSSSLSSEYRQPTSRSVSDSNGSL